MKKLILFLACIITGSANAQYVKLNDFAGASGEEPLGSMVSDGTYMYGTAPQGGLYDHGAIYRIKPDGSAYSVLFNFTNGLDGASPGTELVLEGGYLYGMTGSAGAYYYGNIFKVMPDGTGFTSLYDFDGSNGAAPHGSLISDGTYLYGMTIWGGTNNKGVIFKIKNDGTGFTKLYDFAGGASSGALAWGSLIYDGVYLYGMTANGGAFDCGVIFKIKPDGTGYTDLIDFPAPNTNPCAALISDGTYLYGMAPNGGAYNLGIAFRIKKDGTAYSILHVFDYTASQPMAALVSAGAYLYGTTQGGGTSNMGVIFKIKPDGTGFSVIYNYTNTTVGRGPWSSLTYDGYYFYGTTLSGGTSNKGSIFKFHELETSITDNDIGDAFKIYPNPGTGVFFIDKPAAENGKIEIINLAGKTLYTYTASDSFQNLEINLSNQPDGIYFIRYSDLKKSVVKKLIISR